MRLVDADKLEEHLFVGADYDKAIDDGISKTEEEVFAFKCGWNDALKSVAQFAPTVDPVKHGRWINANEGMWNTVEVLKCSVCGEIDNRMYRSDAYCPYCGAKMDERREDGEVD